MPFPDERGPVPVVEYRPQWPLAFEPLAEALRDALGDLALGADHVGSASVRSCRPRTALMCGYG
ncbi:GrpB family protein [Streptomyces sp. NPDC059398]|uniref:GrpB family protein n=1 Tax=Streptomyces sp. NPDC059398 TaxID=3346820 RepID=UPI003692A2FE